MWFIGVELEQETSAPLSHFFGLNDNRILVNVVSIYFILFFRDASFSLSLAHRSTKGLFTDYVMRDSLK